MENDLLAKLADDLLALKVYGGVTEVKIPLEVPEDETKLAELELIYNARFAKRNEEELEKEAAELVKRYQKEARKQKIAELGMKLAEIDEESDEYERILREIRDLQRG